MHIDSVRELKAECFKQHIEPLLATRGKLSGLALSARPVKLIDQPQRTIALGIGRRNENDFRLAVRLQSQALENSPEIEAIVQKAKGEADVRYIGRLVKRVMWNRIPQRPLLIGVSIGHYRITAGTLGCFVKTRNGDAVRILSNNHVLADENGGRKGDAILQPGAFDGGKKPRDVVGTLDRFVRLKKTGSNFVDCALATVSTGIQYNAKDLRGFGTLTGIAATPLDIGDNVSKVGRTTGLTHGRVKAIELDNVIVGYDIGNLRFDGQIEIEGTDDRAFSQGGDSGSLIVNADRKAVALLFAGGDQGGSNGRGLTYGNPIDKVFDSLGVDLIF